MRFGEDRSLGTGRKHLRYKLEWERIKAKHDRHEFRGVSGGGVLPSFQQDAPSGMTGPFYQAGLGGQACKEGLHWKSSHVYLPRMLGGRGSRPAPMENIGVPAQF